LTLRLRGHLVVDLQGRPPLDGRLDERRALRRDDPVIRCAQASGTAHFILDVNGYFGEAIR